MAGGRRRLHRHLRGRDPVWEWTSGALLRPVVTALPEDDAERFADEVKRRYRLAYPPDHTETVLVPFSRLFLVAVRK